MTVQINLKIPDKYYEYITNLSKEEGYLSVQEFIRSLIRDNLKGRLNQKELKIIDDVYNKTEANNSWKSKDELLSVLKN